MDKLKLLILKHPSRIKYSLIILNIFFIIIAIRIYINYISIKTTIQDTVYQTQQKKLELSFSEKFLFNYEKSDFAKYFLQHENNILSPGEFIIKFEKLPDKIVVTSGIIESDIYIKTSQQSWKQFISDKFSKIK